MNEEREQPKYFIYCRKSSEDDRQAASIGDQLRELNEVVEREGLALASEPFREEKSAKGPGRPVFSDMLRRIERGEADAILCWDIDRLYRNPVDEGRVRWLLQRGVIREIRTPFRTFYPHDAGLLMGVEGGRATDHIITLRKGVLRGFRGKLEKGQRPGPAPPGYLNNLRQEKGERDIIKDPDRFALIRKAWHLMLTGQYSIREIHRIAGHEWGLRSRKTKKLGGRPYTISAWYRIFTNPFYYGYFRWKTPGKETRKLYKGAHSRMITRDEFDRVQAMLGRGERPAPKKRSFAFTGLIRCGECEAMVTAEEKRQIICSGCRLKFSSITAESCPRCGLPSSRMPEATRLHYVYYHCTKRTGPCSQRSVRVEDLEQQIADRLDELWLPERVERFFLTELERQSTEDAAVESQAEKALATRAEQLRRELQHINAMILSPDTDWSLITRDEVKERKGQIQDELADVTSKLGDPQRRAEEALEMCRRTVVFAAHGAEWFREGDARQQRAILAGLGSNLGLIGQKLRIELREPLQIISELKNGPALNEGPFELSGDRMDWAERVPLEALIPGLRGAMNAIRTYWRDTFWLYPIPVLRIVPQKKHTDKRRAA